MTVWIGTDAYEVMQKYTKEHKLGNRLLNTLARAFPQHHDGSLDDLEHIANGAIVCREVGDKSRKVIADALLDRQPAQGDGVEILQLCAIPPGWRACYAYFKYGSSKLDIGEFEAVEVPIIMGALCKRRKSGTTFSTMIVPNEDEMLEPVTTDDDFVTYMSPDEDLDTPRVQLEIAVQKKHLMEKRLMHQMVQKLGCIEAKAERFVWGIYDSEREDDLASILQKLCRQSG